MVFSTCSAVILPFDIVDFVVLADGRQAAIERRLVHFLQQHRNAGVRVVHRDAAAHRAGADDRGALDRRSSACPSARRGPWRPRARRRTGGAAPSIRSRRRSRRTARARAASPRRRPASGRLRSRRRRRTAPRTPCGGLRERRAHRLAGLEPGLRRRRLDRRCRGPCGCSLRRGLAPSRTRSRRPADRRRRSRSMMPGGLSAFGGGDRLAVGAHLERQLGAAQPRQPLRAAGAGNDAEQHFRLADSRPWRRRRGSGTPWRLRGRRRARCRESRRRAAWRRLPAVSDACGPPASAPSIARASSAARTP